MAPFDALHVTVACGMFSGCPQFEPPGAVCQAASAFALAQSQSLQLVGNGSQAAASPPFFARMQYCVLASHVSVGLPVPSFTLSFALGHVTVVAGCPPLLEELLPPDELPPLLDELLAASQPLPPCALPLESHVYGFPLTQLL